MDPEALAKEVRRAAEILSPSLFKLTGGEPLLHPKLIECLEAVRATRISSQISLTTNGLLLPTAPPALFGLIDRLTVSWYLSAPLPGRTISWIEDRCRETGVLLNLKAVSEFQRMTPDEEPQSAPAAARAFASCWMRERCHLIYRDRFFTCTRPPHLESLGHGSLSTADGVPLDSPRLLEQVLDLLEREEALDSCRYCLGTSGPYEAHRQL